MNRALLFRAFAVAACVLLAAPAWSAQHDPAPTQAAGLAEARALILQRKYEAALAVLLPIERGGTVEANVVFHIGIAAIGAAQRPGISEELREALLDKAIASFRSMLIDRPELVRVRLELARAFFLKEEDTLARRHFEQVLAGKPPAAVALNVNRFLNIMRARKRWSLRVGASLLPDSNIGADSDERIVYIDFAGQRLPFRLDEEPSTSSGIGVSAWLGGEYQYPLGAARTGAGAGNWRLRAGGDVARKEYRTSEFDRTTVSGHLGPRWLIGRGSEVSLLLSGLHEWAGSGIEEPSHYDIGLRVEAGHRLNRRTTVNARASRHERRFDAGEHRDGPVTDVSVGVGWVASPTFRIDAGVGWGRQRTERKTLRNENRRVRLGATAALPWGFTVGGFGMLRWTDYEGEWLPFVLGGGPRRDLTRSIRLNVHNRAVTVAGFSPQISVLKEDRTTNAQLHDYERLSGELRFVRLF